MTLTETIGIIVGALSFQDNPFDGHTLTAVLSQVESILGQRPTMAICDRGYRGKRKIGVTSIEIPESGRRKKTASDKRQARERFRRRAAIEPIIDDSINLLMACAAFNFRKFIRILFFLCLKFLGHILRPNVQPVQACA